jgi:hypothetical protein
VISAAPRGTPVPSGYSLAVRLPPALAASATPRILELLPPPPALVLELGFAGIHATPLRLAGYEVVVVEPDPSHLERAGQRAGKAVAAVPELVFDAVVAPAGLDAPPALLVLVVDRAGTVRRKAG